MRPDWNLVTLEHIEQACAMYDSGVALPKRPAQSTYLVLNGKTYPGKFIRGQAYRLATGIELDPNEDYSGGLETVRFYRNLGLVTQHTPLVSPTAIASPKPQKTRSFQSDSTKIRRLALISHDYNILDSVGMYGYTEHFAIINSLCDQNGCDTILYALYTWDRELSMPKSHAVIFNDLVQVQRVILEVGQLAIDEFDHVEIWDKTQIEPLKVFQRFATSSASGSDKEAFLGDLEQRLIGDSLLMICGETNIASMQRGSNEFYDPYDFATRLKDMGIRLILNPIHDYMRRYEMREKRRYFSRENRTVVSVWNKGKGKEAHLPWTIFRNGEEATKEVKEISHPFTDRPDIRIGIVDIE